MKNRPVSGLATVLLAIGCMSSSFADDALSVSGFASAVTARVMNGERQESYLNHACPCFIADYGHGAMYGPRWSFGPESKVGLQGTYTFTPKVSATVQAVARGVEGPKVGLEWAYLTYDVSPSWTLQVGRKRLPIYYYSDFQDVGYAYTWVRPPTDIYGWEIVNYNGVNATYRADWAGWAVKSNLLFGRETTKDNLYHHLYYDTPQDVTWGNIIGGDLIFGRDWLTVRATYMQSDVQQFDRGVGERITPEPDSPKSAEKQRIYGVAANVDIDNWFARTEYSIFDRSGYSYKSRAYMVGVGARFGKFTPMVTVTRYGETNTFTPDVIQHDHGLSMTLRYELTGSSALKVQIDRFLDRSLADFVGSSNVISMSLDTVF